MPRRLRASGARALPALLLVLGAACSDSTEPAPRLVVTATLANTPTPLIVGGTPTTPTTLVRCAPQVRLLASGAGRSHFGAATIFRYNGPTRTTPVDSTPLSPAFVQQAFAATVILPDANLLAVWTVDDSIPFTARFVIRHRPEGSDRDETLTVDAPCGPAVTGATTPPVVSNVTLATGAGDLEPGDTLVVRYDASVPLGLWRSSARLTGPCEVSAERREQLQTSGPVEYRLPIPVTCPLGVPFSVRVTATDGGLRVDTLDVLTNARLFDRVAPVVQSVGNATGLAVPTLFAGDTLRLRVAASDNVRLAWLTVAASASGPVDSVALDPDVTGEQLVRLPVRDAWAGAPTLRVRAIDAAGNASAEIQTPSGFYRFHPTIARASTGVTMTGQVSGLVVDRQGRAHLMQYVDSRIVTLARGTLATVATMPLDPRPVGMALVPSGDSLIVTQEGERSFRVVDLTGSTPVLGPAIPIQGLDAAKGESPMGLVVTARGTAFVAIRATSIADWRFAELDLATATMTPRATGVSGPTADRSRMVRSGDGRTVLLSTDAFGTWPDQSTCARRWTLDSDAIGSCQPLPEMFDGPVSMDRLGTVVATSRRFLDGALGAPRPIVLAQSFGPIQPLLAPNGATAYAPYRGGLARMRTSDGATLDLLRGTAATEGRTGFLLALSPDGTVAVMASYDGTLPSRVITMELP